ncbi:reductase [Wenxinia marina]|uniref:Nucleoside-diphosphate-sugar epimerase n=2 Tax=Wenxinia TaxID=653686 RepID=A0A0D0PIQ0_9RHOB|nr:NAD-dependent epimerase/dehydratase family protein [Wenxinia marina]KIQ71226.1 Nucleoside-diphosphate-sugar epimerase [Wenxinia marina DSM 24838]GGL81484.1 reductase [Wenxinia marina]
MPDRALVIGASGQVGRAVCDRLAGDGWAVTAVQRRLVDLGKTIRTCACDRDSSQFDDILAEGFDVVVDMRAFGEGHAVQLIRHANDIGSVILLSSAAVYRGENGRTIEDGLTTDEWPRYPTLISEDDPVVAPDDTTYAGQKRAVEEALLQSVLPTTVLRAAAIHGPHSSQPREWFYIKRLLDGRRRFVLGYDGKAGLHPVAADNLAEMARLAARRPGDRILNAGDPGAPVERDTGAAIAAAMGMAVDIRVTSGTPPIASPYSLPSACLLSLDAAVDSLGYAPVASHREAIAGTCRWILAEHAAGRFKGRLSSRFGPPGLGVQVFGGFGHDPFDYQAEDRLWEELEGPDGPVIDKRRA